MKTMRSSAMILMLVVFLGLSTGCTAGETTSQQIGEIQSIFVNMPTEPQTLISETKNVLLSNCGGSSILTQSFGSLASVSNTSTIETVGKSSDGGEIQVYPTLKLRLQTELEKAYLQILSSEISRIDEILLSTNPNTSTTYEVQWEQHIYSSTISYNAGGQVYDTAYEYKINIPKISNSSEAPCDTVDPAIPGACPGAPMPQVVIGQTVMVVAEDFDKLKLRSEPRIAPDTELKELDKFTNLLIVNGPVCVTGEANTAYWFWEVQVLPGNEKGWIAEGNLSEYFVK